MVNFVRVFRDNKYILLPLKDYLKENYTELPDGWLAISNWIDRVFKIQNEAEYQSLCKELQVERFDIEKIKNVFKLLENEYGYFDKDILRYISFLSGTLYFSKIGNPSIKEWLSAVDINHPFRNGELNYGYSFIDASHYEFGQNIIRKDLLSTLHWISSQAGG